MGASKYVVVSSWIRTLFPGTRVKYKTCKPVFVGHVETF